MTLPNIDNRIKVIQTALFVEQLTSTLVAHLIGIDDSHKSYSFGHTSKALSFNNKVHLLIDIGALKKVDQDKFIKFSEVRNQMVHNLLANTPAKWKEAMEQTINKILTYYPKDSLFTVQMTKTQLDAVTEDEHITLAIDKLCDDVLGKAVGIIETLQDKIAKDMKHEIDGLWVESQEEALEEVKREFEELIDTNTKNGITLTAVDLKKFVSKIISHITLSTNIKIDKKLEEKRQSK